MTFYERLQKLCRGQNTTPSAVAKLLGISTGSVSAWKTGAVPSSMSLNKLSTYFGVTVDYLLNGTETVVYETSDIEEEIFSTISLLQDPKIRKLLQRLIKASQGDLTKIDKLLDLFDLGAENG